MALNIACSPNRGLRTSTSVDVVSSGTRADASSALTFDVGGTCRLPAVCNTNLV